MDIDKNLCLKRIASLIKCKEELASEIVIPNGNEEQYLEIKKAHSKLEQAFMEAAEAEARFLADSK